MKPERNLPNIMNEKIKVGLVGFGKAATIFHLPLIQHYKQLDIVSVVSSDKNKVKRLLPNVSVFNTLEKLLDSSDTQLIIITTPNHLHFKQAKVALEANKHVVVEKPFVLNVSDGEELIKIANERNLKLTVFHNRRWDNGFLTLKDLMSIDKLGEINLFESRFDRYRPLLQGKWREQEIDGSGTLWDLGSHLIDQAFNLFGEPNKIASDIERQRRGAKATDYFHIYLSYNKCKVILKSSSLSHMKTPHLFAQGEKATFFRTEMDPQEEALKAGHNPATANWGKDRKCCSYLFEEDSEGIKKSDFVSRNGAYEEFYKLLIDAILEDKSVPVCPKDALKVVKLIRTIEKEKLIT